MELRGLEYFVAVAEERSFTRAAARCHVAQPSISYQIRALERELGESLFDRGPHGVTLTVGGETLLPHARACLAAAAAAKAAFGARSDLLGGRLALGTVIGTHETRLPRVLAAFRETYPLVRVTLTSGGSAPLIAGVADGSLDAAVVAEPRAGWPLGVNATPLQADEIVAVVADSAPLDGDVVKRSEVVAFPLISYAADSALRALLADEFGADGLSLDVAQATNDVALQVALARAGAGVALSAAYDPEVSKGAGIRTLRLDPPVPFTKALAWRSAPGAVLTAFLQLWTSS